MTQAPAVMPAAESGFAPHVAAVRAEFAVYVQTYRDLVAAASKASGASLVRIDGALAAFEPGYFNNLLVALDARFENHSPDAAGAIAEVRAIRASLIAGGGAMKTPAGVAYAPDASVLRIDIGDRIALNADDFEAIAAAFLDAVARTAA